MDILRTELLLIKYFQNWFEISLARFDKTVSLHEGRLRGGSTVRLFTKAVGFEALAKLLDAGWSVRGCSNEVILLRNGDVRMKCRPVGDDIANLTEVFLDKVYGDNFTGMVVVDVGAGDGDSALFFCMKGAARVIALEPSIESFELGAENIRLNGVEERVIMLHMALSDENGRRELVKIRNSPSFNSSRTSQTKPSQSSFEKLEVVSSITLERLFNDYAIGQLDLLKMDCEGCEYDAFRNAPQSLMTRIQNIILEYHNGAEELIAILAKNGFIVSVSGSASGILRASRGAHHTV